MTNIFYEGNVLWAYDTEINSMNVSERFLSRHFSLVPPLSKHKGRIYLTGQSLMIDGDQELLIPLADMDEIYHGFDEVFAAASAKNFGMSWQPLRISYANGHTVYLIVDYNYITTANLRFFNLLKELLS